jgi:hypothetical protein
MDKAAHSGRGGSARQCGGGFSLALGGGGADGAMGTAGEVDSDIDARETLGPIGLRADVADRTQSDPGDGVRRAPRRAEHGVAVPRQAMAQRATDKARRTGNQNTGQRVPSISDQPTICASDRPANALERAERRGKVTRRLLCALPRCEPGSGPLRTYPTPRFLALLRT